MAWLNVATGMKDLPAEARCRCLSSSLAGGVPFVQAPLQRHLNIQLVMTSDLKVEKLHGVFRKKLESVAIGYSMLLLLKARITVAKESDKGYAGDLRNCRVGVICIAGSPSLGYISLQNREENTGV